MPRQRLLLVVLLINYQGRPAAWATKGRVELYPRIAALEADHPTRRWVTCTALIAMEALGGGFRGMCSQAGAEHLARCALMPDDEFEPLWDFEDVVLAEHFVVPIEQVYEKRVDLLALAASEPFE